MLKGCPQAITLAEEAKRSLEKVAASQITRMELLGCPKLTDDEERAIRIFLGSCQVLVLDERIEVAAIRLCRIGSLKLPYAIVAATAITGALRLLTLDQGMVQGLRRLGYPF